MSVEDIGYGIDPGVDGNVSAGERQPKESDASSRGVMARHAGRSSNRTVNPGRFCSGRLLVFAFLLEKRLTGLQPPLLRCRLSDRIRLLLQLQKARPALHHRLT